MQSLLYFDFYYSLIVVLISAVLLMFKLRALVFPAGQFFTESAVLVGYALLSYNRLAFGIKGNRIERVPETVLMLLFAVFCVFCNCYFCFYQTYILVIELVLHIAAVAFITGEALLALFAIVVFSSLDKASSR